MFKTVDYADRDPFNLSNRRKKTVMHIRPSGFLALIYSLYVGNAWSNQADDLFAAMESGKCESEAVLLHKMALTGDSYSQLIFANAANKDLCSVVERLGVFSIHWYRKSAEQGNAAAQAALAKHLATSWNRENETEAMVWYQRAVDQGNADAKFGMAQMYGRGNSKSDNLRKNDELALKLYKEAAAKGHKMSYYLLALIYEKGDNGVKKDDVVAAYWYRKLADSGDASAQGQLARMYETGVGVEENHVEARTWYEKSANQGNRHSQTSLAKMYRSGKGGPRDEKMTLQLFHQAAESNDSNAQYELGMIYATGLNGVPPDIEKSTYWLEASANYWHPLAIKELENRR